MKDFGDPSDPETKVKAFECADTFVARQREMAPDIAKKYPDILFPMKEACQFYYVMCRGNWTYIVRVYFLGCWQCV